MRVHNSINPKTQCPPEQLGDPIICPGCKKEFILKTGVVIRMHYHIKNQNHYGLLAFHSLECLMKNYPSVNAKVI